MTAKSTNRLVIILITATLMLLMLLDFHLSPVRALIAIALVAVLPGYALATSIFVNVPLGIMEKVAFSFGFSLGMTSLGGLLLNYTPWGLQPVTWVVLLGGISLAASGFTLLRINDIKEADVSVRVVHVPLRIHQVLLMVLAAVLLIGSYLFARTGAESRISPPLTRMWMSWSNAEHNEVVLKVQNQEAIPMQYQLQFSTLHGDLQEEQTIVLASGEIREIHYAVPRMVAENDFIKAELFLANAPEESYREVFLRLDAK